MRATLFLSSLFFLLGSISVQAKAPWQTEESQFRVVPWKPDGRDPERKERREGFFRKLTRAFEPKHPEQEMERGRNELSELPWSSYDERWNIERESALIWPVDGGKISSGYGLRRGRFHEGLDIDSSSGARVRSVASGRVVFSGTIRGYGNTVVVYHGDDFASIYAHNRENLARVGQIVTQGQTIATLGSSGNVTGSHLHFEIRVSGKPENPLKFDYAQARAGL